MTDSQERMLHTDAFSWYMESDRGLRSTVVALALLDRAPDWGYLRQRVDRMTRLVPLFRRRVQEPPWRIGPPRWTVDPDFDLDFHMRRARLAQPASWAAALDVARVAAMADFDRDRPLWELTLLEGLPGGKAALLTKVHHCLSDGIGAIELLGLVVDGDRDLPSLGDLPALPAGTAGRSLLLDSVGDDVREAAHVARWAGRALGRLPGGLTSPAGAATAAWDMAGSVYRIVRPIVRQASPLMTERQMVRHLATLDVPLDSLRQAAVPHGGHVNDAFLAAVTGGLRRYHESHGSTADDLRVTMPMSIRRPGDPIGGNRIVLLRFALPSGIADPAERIARIARLSQSWRLEPAIGFTQAIAFALNLAPRSYVQGVLRRVDFVASDVPGLAQAVYVAGARVLAYYPFGPTIGSALNATLMSYDGTCNVGINIDVGAVPDADDLVGHLRDGFDEVLALAAQEAPKSGRRSEPSAASVKPGLYATSQA